MIKAILLDDENKSIEILMWELGSFKEDIEVLATFTDPEEALIFLKKNTVDVIFLDIEMPTMDGFTFIDQLNNKDIAIVFVTAYSEHALRAIRKEAYDYLLKPINSNHLKESIEKIKKRKLSHGSIESLEKVLLNLSYPHVDKKIPIHTDGCLVFIESNKIIYAKADGSYTKLIIQGEKDLLISKKLKEIEEMIDSQNFYRVHHSYLVNLQKIKRFYKTEGYLIMDDASKIPVSRGKKNDFLNQF